MGPKYGPLPSLMGSEDLLGVYMPIQGPMLRNHVATLRLNPKP